MESITAADLLFSSTTNSVAQLDSLAAGALGRGIDRFMAKDYTMAVREFRRSIAMSPYSDNALKAFEYLANAFIKNGKTSEAIQAYRQATKIFPSADGMHLNLGNLFYSEGRYNEAVEEYKAAVRISPTLSQNIYSLGQAYLAQDRYADAEEQFKRAVQLSPKDSGGYYALGQTYRKMGRLTEAQEQLNQALAVEKDFAEAHFELGMIYIELGQTDEAQAKLAILKEKGATVFYAELLAKILETSSPRFTAVYSPDLNLAKPAGTRVSSLDSSLSSPGATKEYTVNFLFDKQMDAASVRSIANWNINRSTSTRTGGAYNWGMKLPTTEVEVPYLPVSVVYDPDSLTANVTFSISQNASGNGTIDLSHLVFKFRGADGYGNRMDTLADEYNRIAKII